MSALSLLRARRARRSLLRELDQALLLAEDPALVDRRAPGVSRWSVREHLEHLWRADAGIVAWVRTVAQGEPRSDGRGWTLAGTAVLWLGWIPRGKGRAPEPTRPLDAPSAEIAQGLRSVRATVEGLEGALERLAASPATLRHPLLGCFTAPRWLRFAQVHHAHHRRIVAQILAGRSA